MSSPFVAEIRIFPYNFAPVGWAVCNGQLLPISQNTALFSLLGTTYGGNGTTTFALPNLQNGAIPVGQGQGAGLSDYDLGQSGGESSVTLINAELPAHNHGLNCTTTVATVAASEGTQLAKGQKGNLQSMTRAKVYSTNAPTATLNPATAMGPTGSSLPHNNMMPNLALNFCIAMQGVFPPRS
jgi:microcystin-dependent protein